MGRQHERVRECKSELTLLDHKPRDFVPEDIITMFPQLVLDLSKLVLLSGKDLSLLDRIVVDAKGCTDNGIDNMKVTTGTLNLHTHTFG